MKTIILQKGEQFETWSQLTDLCESHKEFSYNYIKRLKFPFEYKGYKFVKVEHKTKLIY